MIKYVITMMQIIFMNFVNMILRFLGYTRIYDIQNGRDLTIIYYLLKYINKLGINIDISYPKLGICEYVDGKFIRYIRYDERLSESSRLNCIGPNFSSKNYHDIKRIDMIVKTDNNCPREIVRVDITDAKKNFFDLNNFTDISDIVRFYLTTTNQNPLINSIKTINSYKNKTILITREKFDDEILEFITTCTEIQFR